MAEKYISVDAAKRAIQRALDNGTGYGEALSAIPAADVRPVVPAKWIALDIYRGMGNYKCSACNQECYVPECMGEPMYIYCPNCGAYMRPDTTDN